MYSSKNVFRERFKAVIDVDFRRFPGSGWLTRTHIGRSLTCCNDQSIEVIGLQSGVGGDQLRPRVTHKAHRGIGLLATAVPSRVSLVKLYTAVHSLKVMRFGTYM